MNNAPSQILAQALRVVVAGDDLSEQAMNDALGSIMDGRGTDAQIAGLLTGLRMKGETRDEIVGAVRAMRSRAATINDGPDCSGYVRNGRRWSEHLQYLNRRFLRVCCLISSCGEARQPCHFIPGRLSRRS